MSIILKSGKTLIAKSLLRRAPLPMSSLIHRTVTPLSSSTLSTTTRSMSSSSSTCNRLLDTEMNSNDPSLFFGHSYKTQRFPSGFFDRKPKLALSELPPDLQQVIKLFSDIQQDPELLLRKILPYYSSHNTPLRLRPRPRVLPPLRDFHIVRDNKVLLRQTYIRAYIDRYDDPDNKVWFEVEIDCDGEDSVRCAVTRALAGLLLHSLSGRPLADLTPDFFALFIGTLRPTHYFYCWLFEIVMVLRKKCLLLLLVDPMSSSSTAGSGYYSKLRSILPSPDDHHDEPTKLVVSDLPAHLQPLIKLFSDIREGKVLLEDKISPSNSNVIDGRPYNIITTGDGDLHNHNNVFKTSDNKVDVSSADIWVRAFLDPPGGNNVRFEAYFNDNCFTSRSLGLFGLLFESLSGRPLADLTPDFFTLFHESITPTNPFDRVFVGVLKLMQRKCLLLAQQTKLSSSSGPIPPNLQQVIQLFSDMGQDELLFAKKLRPYYFRGQKPLSYTRLLRTLHPRHRTKGNKVEGCSSPMWLRAYMDTGFDHAYDPDKKVWFEAAIDDCPITRALAGLLFQSLSGRPLSELTHPDFFPLLQSSITPSTDFKVRFLCLVKVMHKKCRLLADSASTAGGSKGERDELELELEVKLSESYFLEKQIHMTHIDKWDYHLIDPEEIDY